MWYLIIPPIIIVFCLALLLWYLSRKGSDPAILEKIDSESKPERKATFLKTKNFFLKFLEKMSHRFKVRTLKMHNAMGTWSLSLKKKREIVGELAAQQRQAATGDGLPKERALSRLRFWKRSPKDGAVSQEESVRADETAGDTSSSLMSEEEDRGALGEPLLRRRFQMEQTSNVQGTSQIASDIPEENQRPMVSETVTEPEVRRRKQRRNVTHEETLIERIAENPKDFTAYEALGDYYMGVENTKDAKECYRQVLKLRPVHRLVKIKIRRLEKILTDKS